MKNLTFEPGQGPVFSLMYSRFVESGGVRTDQIGMFNRILEAMNTVSSGNEELLDRMSAQIRLGEGKEFVDGLYVNRRLNFDGDRPVVIELQDEDFALLRKRIGDMNSLWNPLVTRRAEELLDILAHAALGSTQSN